MAIPLIGCFSKQVGVWSEKSIEKWQKKKWCIWHHMKTTMNQIMNHSRKKKWDAGACKLAGSKPKSVTTSLPGDVCTSKASWAISTHLHSLNHHHIIPCIWFLVHCLHLFSGFTLLSLGETWKIAQRGAENFFFLLCQIQYFNLQVMHLIWCGSTNWFG